MTDSPTLDERVEVMARAIIDHGEESSTWLSVDEIARDHYRGAAQAALTALESAGYVVAKPFWPPEEIEEAWRG